MTAPLGWRAMTAWTATTAVVGFVITAAFVGSRQTGITTALTAMTVASMALAGQVVASTVLLGQARRALRQRAHDFDLGRSR